MKNPTVLGSVLMIILSATTTSGLADTLTADWDVEALRAEIAADHLTFDVAENWVTRFLAAGGNIKDITGLERPANWEELGRFTSLAEEELILPKSFSWPRLVGRGLQPIRNQGSCGSCWAFSITAVIESLHMIAQGHSDLDLAEQTLVSSCEEGGTCSGGYFDAFDYVARSGLPSERDDPYVARNTSCRQNLAPKGRIRNWGYIGAAGREPTTEEIKQAIFKYGPVSVDVNGSFGAYAGGIYNRCNTGGTNHMVTLEGWDDVDQVWIMRNSWGAEWGENGYMRIKFTDAQGRKCNGIGRVAAFAEI